MTEAASLLFYSELARWWPLISPVDHYAEEADYALSLVAQAHGPVETLLELGSGGGHNAFFMKRRHALALVDLSPHMLAMSEALNPECEHLLGDMRDVRLGRTFDAVFLHDAVDYLCSETDLAATFETAFVHCRPGGVLVVIPDDVAETFEAGADHGGSDADDGSGVRYLEWTHAPDDSGRVHTDYAFVVREADARTRHYHETHEFGLFPITTWQRCLEAAGFDVETERERTDEARPPRYVFIAHRPLE